MNKTLSFSNALNFSNFFVKKTNRRRFSAVPAMVSGTRTSRAAGRSSSIAFTAAETQRLWLAYIFIGFILILIIISILSVNFYAARGYVIKSLQNKVMALEEQKQKLDIKVAEAGSVLMLQQDLTTLGYVPSGLAQYVIPTTQLSKR